jgi:MFS family permease
MSVFATRRMTPHITTQDTPPKGRRRLTTNQIRGFWAAWAGWALDGMDSFIYALVLVPALRDLLPASGIRADAANTGFYGGLLFALFLIGWGLAFLWGPIADRFGRVRTLMLTILCYSAFTFAGALATNVWALGLFRLKSGPKTGACGALPSCIPAITLGRCLHRSLISASARTSDGARCSLWAARRRS